MRIFGKTLLGFLFNILLTIFLILTVLHFQLLNQDFLFSNFEKNGIYEKIPDTLAPSLPNDPNLAPEERQAYSEIAKNISPDLIKKIIETNISEVLGYIHGKVDDVVLSFPVKDLGIPESQNITWLLSEFNKDPVLQSRIEILHGIASKILIAWFVVLVLLIAIPFLYARLLIPKRIVAGASLMISAGISFSVLGTVARFFLLQMSRDLPNAPEPSQRLLGLLAQSILPQMTNVYLFAGVILLTLGIILFILDRKMVTPTKSG